MKISKLQQQQLLTYLLSQLGQVAATDDVVRLQEDFSQFTLARRVKLQIESIKTMKCIIGMHIKRINRQIVGGEIQGLEYLAQSQILTVSQEDRFIGTALEFVLDKTEKVLLVHASTVVHVCVHLSTVVEISVGNPLLSFQFFRFV